MENSGHFTSQIYGFIRDFDYGSALNVLEVSTTQSKATRNDVLFSSLKAFELIRSTKSLHSLGPFLTWSLQAFLLFIFQIQLQRFPRSRAALSLLGYCYYHIQDYELASEAYGKLMRLYPQINEYRIYYSQSLLKIGEIEEARQTEFRLQQYNYNIGEDEQRQQHRTQRELLLQACIKFEEGQFNACRGILNRCVEDDPGTMIAQATLSAKEGRYDDALELYSETFNTQGFEAELAYNIALCYYMIGEYEEAMDAIEEIISRGIEVYPEFGPNKNSEFEEKMDVSNTIQLQESFLVEAYNLKAAIEFTKNEEVKARETLKLMPQRKEEELDPVTLHNQGLMNSEMDVNGCFEKLKFLLATPPFPPETFGNLLLLYCKLGHYDLCADILAENSHLTYDYLSEELYEFLDTLIMSKASPDEALVKFDELIKKYTVELRKMSKDIEANESNDDDSTIKRIKSTYEETMKSFVPILMAQASMFWEREDYNMIEQLFRKSADLCVDVDAWRLNVAHVFFVQQKFKDAIKYYETFVKNNGSGTLLSIAPIVLANLCVSFIMTNQNENAEEIMKQVENEEDDDQEKGNQYKDANGKEQNQQSCIINLVIGTLYCEKGNFEFGISRICKSLEPLEKKLGADTWFYTKRCLLALLDYMAKQRLILKRDSFQEIISFLRDVYKHGKDMKADFGNDGMIADPSSSMRCSSTLTVSSEVLYLKKMFCKLMK